MKYVVYHINGYLFRTESREGIVNQNSRFALSRITRTYLKKEEVTYDNNFYYSVQQDIWVVDYHIRNFHIFMCD